MKLQGLFRYPFKSLAGERLEYARLARGTGIPGDRRFAFGRDGSKANGRWYPTRNYIVNLLCDNLLKYQVASDGDTWILTTPDGQSLTVDPANLGAVADQLDGFLAPVLKPGMKPCLVDRATGDGPNGFWDFRDSELLILNLNTLRALEQAWGIQIDPKRVRANLLLEDIPAWSEFGLYGAELEIGGATVEILRPARRCIALSVNPVTGDKDVPIHHMLMDGFGHGFLGVYARVSVAGDIAIGDAGRVMDAPRLPVEDLICDGAPDVALWPKSVEIQRLDAANLIMVTPLDGKPLVPLDLRGRMKLHLGHKQILQTEIVRTEGAALVLEGANLGELSSECAYVTGPYGGRPI